MQVEINVLGSNLQDNICQKIIKIRKLLVIGITTFNIVSPASYVLLTNFLSGSFRRGPFMI